MSRFLFGYFLWLFAWLLNFCIGFPSIDYFFWPFVINFVWTFDFWGRLFNIVGLFVLIWYFLQKVVLDVIIEIWFVDLHFYLVHELFIIIMAVFIRTHFVSVNLCLRHYIVLKSTIAVLDTFSLFTEVVKILGGVIHQWFTLRDWGHGIFLFCTTFFGQKVFDRINGCFLSAHVNYYRKVSKFAFIICDFNQCL